MIRDLPQALFYVKITAIHHRKYVVFPNVVYDDFLFFASDIFKSVPVVKTPAEDTPFLPFLKMFFSTTCLLSLTEPWINSKETIQPFNLYLFSSESSWDACGSIVNFGTSND